MSRNGENQDQEQPVGLGASFDDGAVEDEPVNDRFSAQTKTGSVMASRSGILVSMSGEIQDEPDDGQTDEQAIRRGDADPAGSPFRRSPAYDAAMVAGRVHQQFAESIARNLLPRIDALCTQQQIAENFLQSMGGFDRLQKQILDIQPQLDVLRVHQQFAESIARNLLPRIDALCTQQQIAENFLQSMGGFDRLQKQILDIQPQLDAFRQFATSIPQLIEFPTLNLPKDWYPPNWEGVADLDIDVAIGIVLDEGVPLVWVPGPAIIAQIVRAPDADARDGILLSLRDEIADDCMAVLGEIGVPELKPLAELAVEAVTALRSGHPSGAQALASNVFDTLLRDAARRGVIFTDPPVGYFKYDKVRKRILPVSDDTAIGRFRAACVLSAALRALEDYDPLDPPPPRFVRHATAHCAHPVQYTPVNATVAVMLMVSMLREAEASGW